MAAFTTADILGGLDRLRGELDRDVAANERNRALPHEAVAALRGSGVLSLRIPVGEGGPGGTIRDQMAAVIAIASVDSNVAQGVRPHFFFIEELRLHGRGDTPRRWWPALAGGQVVGNALSEAGTARVGAIHGTLERAGDGWRLDALKSYSTGALFADLLYVSGKDREGVERRALISAGRAGVSMHDDWDGMGQRTTATGTTTFSDVAVAADELLDFSSIRDGFTHLGGHRQLFLAAVLAGIAANASADLDSYVQRQARPAAHGLTDRAADDPYVLRTAGSVSAAAFAARAIVLEAAEALDGADARPGDEAAAFAGAIDVARAQVAVADLVLPAVDRLFDAGGASATTDAVNLHRHWRNARTIAAHNPLDYKRRAIGDWQINGTEPPRTTYF